jgi:uncharacterized protein YxeA
MIRFFSGASLICTLLAAAPAFHGVRTFIQNDGSSFQAHMQGDEYLSWIETADGEILVYDKKGQNYDYAVIADEKLKSSGEKYTKSNGNNLRMARPFRSVSKEELYRLWRLKRQKGLND